MLCAHAFLTVSSHSWRTSAALTNFAAKRPLPRPFSPFFRNFPVPFAFTEGASDRNVRAREILRPSFRALWCRQFGGSPGRGTAWFSRDRWRDTLFRQRPSSNGLGSVSHASLRVPHPFPPILLTYLPPNRYAQTWVRCKCEFLLFLSFPFIGRT